jgi:histidinol-phosphatase (PHP family)
VQCAQAAKDAGLPVVIGLEVDYYEGRMDEVAALLGGYPFDVLLGSVHWLGAWRFDDLDVPLQMDEWSVREVDATWEHYTTALEELAASGACDVLAHPDLIKVAGYVPGAPAEWWDRMAEAAASSGMAAELSSAGWRKPVAEQYPALPLLQRFAARGVPFTTASDAHRHEQVAEGAASLRGLLDSVGVHSLQGYHGRVPHPVAVGSPQRPESEGA